MEAMLNILKNIKKGIISFENVLHQLPNDKDFCETSDSYRSTILDEAYELKRSLIEIDEKILRMVESIEG